VSGQLHVLATLPAKERSSGTHLIGGWVGGRSYLDVMAKKKVCSLPLPGIEPWLSNP